jgi:CRISPR system Cascade subunit CasB
MPLKEIIEKLSEQMLRRLGPGDLAELRRMTADLVEPSAYWRLAAECGFLDGRSERWMPVVQVMAILTPKGNRLPSDRLHDPKRPLGAVLADGGNPAWSNGDARPFVAEARLARYFATPSASRPNALLRFARMLASKRDRTSGINCVEIAKLLLSGNPIELQREIARTYYARLDAARPSKSEVDEQ